ncbi:hypothetical protein ACHAXT_009916 [Thalassiosira profunda]
MSAADDKAKKAAKKAKLKAEAAQLGIPYETLKAQKKEKKKRKREAAALTADAAEFDGGEGRQQEKRRMRSWSGEFADEKKEDAKSDAAAGDAPAPKRLRTRSMDKAEEAHKVAAVEKAQSPAEWRKMHSIAVRGHGKNAAETKFPDPFLEFDDAPFNPALQRTLKAAGFERPTFIQSQAWPIAIKGNDMISIAKTGSGKTCGFLLPSFHQYLQTKGSSGSGPRGPKRGPMMLVLAPTRELACQILEEAQKFGRPVGIRSVCCYGGAPKYPQIAALDRGVECVIATPGRINDLIEMRKADLSGVKFVVLDEADRMLDMGFEPQIRSIMGNVPDNANRQTLLFSATWPKEIQRLAFDFLQDPVQINVGEINSLNANKDITQNIIMCSEGEKLDKLKEILTNLVNSADQTEEAPKPKATNGGRYAPKPVDLGGKKHSKVIVFVAKKYVAHELANQLWDDGFACDSLHGDRAQWERTKVINAFKTGTLRMLIATDVAARGLDVKDVGAVVNYDMPVGTNGAEDYVHRIGRTGRAGAKGVAHTFFTPGDKKLATELVEILTKAEQEIPDELQRMARPRFGGRGGRGGFGGRGRGRGRGYSGGRGGRGYMGGGGRGGGRGGWGRGRGRGSHLATFQATSHKPHLSMMPDLSDLQYIVARLGEPPFSISIRAVDFDEMSPDDLLSLLVNDVLGSLEPELKVDVHAAARENIVEQTCQFLQLHKCPLIPSPDDDEEHLAWLEGVQQAKKAVLYPVIRWALANFEHLQKRTYLSRFLMPIDVPAEFLGDGYTSSPLEELCEAYKELQAEFGETHQHYESLKAKGSRPASEVEDVIQQLEGEEQLLREKLRREQAQASNDPGFQVLLDEASKLRQAQDDEIRLEEQKDEQLHQKAILTSRLREAEALLCVSASCKDQPLEALEKEHHQSVERIEAVTQRRHEAELALLQAEKEAASDKTDLEYLGEMAAQLEDRLAQKRGELDRLGGRGARLGELDELRGEAEEAVAKQQVAKDATEALEVEKELLLSTNAGLREAIQANGNQLKRPDGTSTPGFEGNVKQQKQELNNIREDILRLKQTEESLQDQLLASKDSLEEKAAQAGVVGFTEVNDTLLQSSQQTAALNDDKTNTLDDITSMVKEIADTLESKKQELEPKIAELKQSRSQYEALQERHGNEKGRYEEAAANLNVGNKEMRSECSRLQKEWAEKEALLTGVPSAGSGLGQGGATRSKEYISEQREMFANLQTLLELTNSLS